MKIAFEKVLPTSDSSFALVDKRARVFDGKFHFHPEYELTLIESSEGFRVVGDSIEWFGAGDLVLLGENLPHQYVSDTTVSTGPATAKVIQFRGDFLGSRLLQAPEARRVAALLVRAQRGLKFHPPVVAAARPLIAELFKLDGFERLLRLLHLLHVLSCDASATPVASAGYTPRISSQEGDKINKALNYLHQHFAGPIALADLCRVLHVAPATCNRLFQKSVGRSFTAVLGEIRLGHACRLLWETDRAVTDIAYASGFMNLSNFNRRFRASKGRTPRAFRSLLRKPGAPGSATQDSAHRDGAEAGR